MPALCLTPEELESLTGLHRPGWQKRVLDHMKIPYRPRPDGTLAVLRIHVLTMEGVPAVASDQETEPHLHFGT